MTDVRAVDLIILAFWWALITGGVTSVRLFYKKHILHDFSFDGDNVIWIAPLAQLLLVFAAPTAVCFLLTVWRKNRLLYRFGLFSLCLLGFLDLALLWPLASWAQLLLAAGLAVQFSRLLAKYRNFVAPVMRWSALTLAACWLVAFAIVEGKPSLAERKSLAKIPTATDDAPNVLLIVLDTVPAAALSLYSPESAATPHLRQIAEGGVVFGHAVSTAPWTAPSHVGMFTGRWNHELSGNLFREKWTDNYPTLAEYLYEQGYVTAGFVGNTLYCTRATGMDRGFVHYEDHVFSLGAMAASSRLVNRILKSRIGIFLGYYNRPGRKSAADINAAFGDWLGQQDDRPFFVFLNYFDVHDPYVAPASYRRHPPRCYAERDLIRNWWSWDKEKLDSEDVSVARAAYDDCLRYLDAEIGRLFAELDRRGRLENTLVIITADHGEQFGEHGLFGHGNSLYEPLVHVPLMFRWPGHIPRDKHIDRTVSLRDLPTTVCDLVDLNRGHPFPGRSLQRFWASHRDERPPLASPVLTEIESLVPDQPNNGRSPTALGPMQAVLSGDWKYIRNGDGSEELYDLSDSPSEGANLVHDADAAAELDRLRSRLRQLRAERKSGSDR